VIKRVILCADGDSSDINLWSNIPFLLGAELERRGLDLVRVNLQAPWLLRRLWRFTLAPRHKLRHWHTSIDFYRSHTNHWLTTSRLNQAVLRYGGPGTILINLSVSASPTRMDIPVMLLSDWSYHHYITERLDRQPDLAELATISRDSAAMARASMVVLLFPESAARLQRQIPAGNFRFLGHVINDHPLAPPPPAQPPATTPNQPWRLLFIGRPRYSKGLELLLQALSLLPTALPVRLDVIGLSTEEFSIPSGLQHVVRLHGYLNKADSSQRCSYYSLLNHADVVINASSLWGGVSATVEAMHRRTAVLTPPYSEFQALFGSTPPFGAYLGELNPPAVAEAISSLLADPALLAQQQQAAFEAVEPFAWKNFVDRLLAELEALPQRSSDISSLSSVIPNSIN